MPLFSDLENLVINKSSLEKKLKGGVDEFFDYMPKIWRDYVLEDEHLLVFDRYCYNSDIHNDLKELFQHDPLVEGYSEDFVCIHPYNEEKIKSWKADWVDCQKYIIFHKNDIANKKLIDWLRCSHACRFMFLFNNFFSIDYRDLKQYIPEQIKYIQDKAKETKQPPTILGAIIGDVIGSVYEFDNYRDTDVNLFPENADFTDDTVLTMAIADSLYNDQLDFAQSLWDYGRNYYGRRYGMRFFNWLLKEDKQPYNSFGNGSAMRVSAIGFFYQTLDDVLKQAKKSAECTHNHPEGIKGAQAVASAIFLARKGKSKEEIKEYITNTFGYNLDFKLDDIRESFEFDMSCAYTIPPAIVAFLESDDYESAIRLAISIGGDSDTIACITGGIACAYYKEIPQEMIDFVKAKLPNEFLEMIEKFDNYVFVDDIMRNSDTFLALTFEYNIF